MLRLYKLKDKPVIAEALERVNSIKAAPFSGNKNSIEQRETEIADEEQKMIYRFLLGNYKEILQICQKNESYLGWSFDIKGIIVPLLMLCLKKDKKEKTKAENALIKDVECKIQFKSMENESFEEYLSLWKSAVDMSVEDKQKYLDWLSIEVDKRTENVVGGGHRHSYHKAAELIVLLGAIREERGEVNAMFKLVEHYKKLHSRKRAFRAEIDELTQMG